MEKQTENYDPNGSGCPRCGASKCHISFAKAGTVKEDLADRLADYILDLKLLGQENPQHTFVLGCIFNMATHLKTVPNGLRHP